MNAAIATAPTRTAMGSRRRRLWELAPASHEWLLAMGLGAAACREIAERCLSRLHGAECRLGGSNADVLAASVRDLGTRNPLSEALQKALEARHAGTVRAMAAHRDAAALRAAWQAALAAPDGPAGALWALLTHPLGATLEDAALADARAWVYERAQTGQAAAARGAVRAASHAQALAAITELRSRLAAAQACSQREMALLRAEAAQLRGLLQRREPAAPRVAALADDDAAGTVPQATLAPAPEPPAAPRRQPAPDPEATAPGAAPVATPARAAEPTARAPAIAGRRVLCVGGLPGTLRRYQNLVESGGGRFAWHDGGLESSVHRLEDRLQGADIVVCQAGCVNHEAYRRIKGHCKRLGKDCVYLKRPSLSSFARGLGLGGH
jgi:hypothetical protein